MNATNIIATITALIIALLASPIMPYLIAKFGTEKAKKDAALFDGYVTKATTAVAAAKQFVANNADKKQFVIDFLTKVGVPENVLDVVTEAAVASQKNADLFIPAVQQIDAAIQAATNTPTPTAISPVVDTTPVPIPPSTYHVIYDGNGADGGNMPLDINAYTSSMSATVQGNISLTKSGYVFSGWNAEADGSGTACAPGVSMTIGNANITLYAVWSPSTVTV